MKALKVTVVILVLAATVHAPIAQAQNLPVLVAQSDDTPTNVKEYFKPL